ncbi:MAG: cell wall hydrolase [Limnochordales bacterium]|nr:cell wall hydrolase [Limnochordales bacterium]
MPRRYGGPVLVLAALLVLALLPVLRPQAVYSQSTYTVQPGDTLWIIARRYGTTVAELQRLNPGVNPQRLQVGQRLTVPGPQDRTAAAPVAGVSRAEDVELLARVIAAEAQGEPYVGQVAVGAVILNRVRSPQFPNSLSGVIYQPHAFESVSNGLVWRRTPSAEAYRAARDALNGWDPTYGALFFWNPSKPVNPWVWSRQITVRIGNHVFAR